MENAISNNTGGFFVTIAGERYYKIENFDKIDDFFMTMTSASDIWNFCWSKGGITAGRADSDHAIFPYYTADKVSDAKSYTGPYTAICVKQKNHIAIWRPFTNECIQNGELLFDKNSKPTIQRNIYKNITGTKIRFEEINNKLELSFNYTWTSSGKYGLVRYVEIINLRKEDKKRKVVVLDGCKNILPACITSDFQNNNSVLLDAYKKTERDIKSNLALFAVSSIVTDKAEPNEGLFANTCWFSTSDTIIIQNNAPEIFEKYALFTNESSPELEDFPDFSILTKNPENTLNGKRPSAFIVHESIFFTDRQSDSWYQVFDTQLDACRIIELTRKLENRPLLVKETMDDIKQGTDSLLQYIQEADGIQNTGDETVCAHHTSNVLFNIMRGGIFANEGKIDTRDLLEFAGVRNKSKKEAMRKTLEKAGILHSDCNPDTFDFFQRGEVRKAVFDSGDNQLERLFLEYMPLTFSRRHGDPSRPWNRFSIKLRDESNNPILNYEGNWRDIFQNWEALAFSYPEYIENMCSKFLNAMTAEGFNPYKITRDGIDWEIPDANNPWAQIGYWGDHQVIYFEKLLEEWFNAYPKNLLEQLNLKIFSTSNVPYRLKPYSEILKNPRDTIVFDSKLNNILNKEAGEKGSDAKLMTGNDGQPILITAAAKMIQIVIAKAANFIPGGGIWLNTQRPEWNDANNALAGYGLSIVTLCYFNRYLLQLIKIFSQTDADQFLLPQETSKAFISLGQLFINSNAKETAENNILRKQFVDNAGMIFEEERNLFYNGEFAKSEVNIGRLKTIEILKAIQLHMETTIRLNKRDDNLYHSYNTMHISTNSIEISHLQEMLEGQVAILSANLLSNEESLSICNSLKTSAMFNEQQNSYMLYPNKTLPKFLEKNCIPVEKICGICADNETKNISLLPFVSKTDGRIFKKDCNGIYHFNGVFRNISILEAALDNLNCHQKPSKQEKERVLSLYEEVFNHQSFTGRSGTFYAYEGLGSIYWHMVAKLLLAVQENALSSLKATIENTDSGIENAGIADSEISGKLLKSYFDIRAGLGFNKTPKLYGAFPTDPYSHTPYGQGAKQPGMTGQVKEEILARWGELGVTVNSGKASFSPILLKQTEFKKNNSLSFTWCGVPVIYELKETTSCLSNKDTTITLTFSDNTKTVQQGCTLSEEDTETLFSRNGRIKEIKVT